MIVDGTPPAADRMRWMDVLRGSAILLVVLSHATRVLAPVVDEPLVLTTVDLFLAPYRMPMLMVLSGLLLPVALAKPLPVYYLGKLRRLLWPYVVWVVVLALLGAAPGPLTDPRTWYATSYLWFLFFLLCYFAVAPLFRRLPPAAVALGAVGLVVASSLLDAATDGRTKELLYLGAFFALGHVTASVPRLLERITTGRVAGLVVILGLAPGVVAVTTDATAAEAPFALLSLVGVLAAVVLARLAVRSGGTRFVEWVGRNSIVFYTVHFPFLVLVARALDTAADDRGPGTGVLAVVGATLAALALASALTAARRVPPVGWLFVMPIPHRRRGRTPTPPHSSPGASPGVPVPAATGP